MNRATGSWPLIVLALLLVLACSDREAAPGVVATPLETLAASPTRSATPSVAASTPPVVSSTPAAVSAWGQQSVFDPTHAGPETWLAACGVPLPALPPGSIECAERVLRETGAQQSAVDFLRAQGYFLSSFEERGRIDYGRGSAPWFNMARPTQQLFLNGKPSVIEVGSIPDTWKTEPSYRDVVAAHPMAFPWTEYGLLVAQNEAGSVMSFEIAYPLRDCRACQSLGFVVMAYGFDAQGGLIGERLLPFRR